LNRFLNFGVDFVPRAEDPEPEKKVEDYAPKEEEKKEPEFETKK